MIPYLLAVVGGYFIGNSMKDETPSIKMSEGGYLKKYNVVGKVRVLVNKDENEYQTTNFSTDVMALDEGEAEAKVEEEIKEDYLLNGYATSMMGVKMYYIGDVEIYDVVEI